MSESTTAMTSSTRVYTTPVFWRRSGRIAYIIYNHQRQVGVSADSLLALDDGDRRRWTNLIRLGGAGAVAFSGALSAFAPQPEDLQQLRQLKHEYDDTTRELEQPSAILEPKLGGDPAEQTAR